MCLGLGFRVLGFREQMPWPNSGIRVCVRVRIPMCPYMRHRVIALYASSPYMRHLWDLWALTYVLFLKYVRVCVCSVHMYPCMCHLWALTCVLFLKYVLKRVPIRIPTCVNRAPGTCALKCALIYVSFVSSIFVFMCVSMCECVPLCVSLYVSTEHQSSRYKCPAGQGS